MTVDTNTIEPGDASNLNTQPVGGHAPVEEIVSVNKKGAAENKLGKGIFILAMGALLLGALAWFSQDWLNAGKAKMKATGAAKTPEDASKLFNPEKTGATAPKLKLGSESGAAPPPPPVTANAARPGADDNIRPVRGVDGKVMVNPRGEAMGVDKDGNMVAVPAIVALDSDGARKPLPGSQSQLQGGGQQQVPKPPSRFGGSLFVGDPAKPSNSAVADGSTPPSNSIAQTQTQQIADILRSAGVGGTQAGRPGSPGGSAFGQSPNVPVPMQPEQPRPGTVGSTLYSSATPVAFAKRLSDQNLVLPKGRQADCVLTGRIIDEVPGFTSCVLAQNMYSDNGRVLLLERGSELTGEYGVTNQLGLERLFVTWNRLKTPEGIEIDLSSPGADRLGTSGVPGNIDNRWAARIGAAFLLSFVKDVTVAIINSQTKAVPGTSVSVQAPGQNTLNSSSALAEEVIKQTIKIRPRLTINEGERISIYVARDLDFSPVYALKTAGNVGVTRPLTR